MREVDIMVLGTGPAATQVETKCAEAGRSVGITDPRPFTFEFAHVAARAGAKVTIIETTERPLAAFDPELVECLAARTRELGIELKTSTEVKTIEKRGDGSLVVEAISAETSESIEVDLVVHGAGRVPNVDGLELEAAGVQFGPQGIEVNEFLQSVSNPAVYAAGRCSGDRRAAVVTGRHRRGPYSGSKPPAR